MKNIIQQRKSERFSLLYSLYRKTDGMMDRYRDIRELASFEGMGYKTFKSSFEYLVREGLLKTRTGDESSQEYRYYGCLTETGLSAIEEVFRDEANETPYFPSFREMSM